MVAWIIYFRDNATYNQQYIQFYIEEGNKLGIDVKLILAEELEFGVMDSRWFIKYRHKDIPLPDFAICRAIHPLLSKQLELMGIPVFNSSFVSEICNDKAKTYQYLAKTGIKMVDSSFYRNCQLSEVLESMNSPTVIKAVEGHGGSQVFLAEPNKSMQQVHSIDMNMRIQQAMPLVMKKTYDTETDVIDVLKQTNSFTTAKDILSGIGSSDVVLQPLTGNKNQDLRVYVIGKEIIAAVLRTAKDGFKSNFSLGGQVQLYPLKNDEIETVNKIIAQFDFGFVGIDFIIGNQGELIFNEIEDVVGSRMLYQCAEINVVERYLKHIIDTLN